MMHRYWVTLVILMVSAVFAIDQSRWDKKATAVWVSAKNRLDEAHLVNHPTQRYQSDLQVPEEDIQEAWQYARQRHAEPIFKATYAGDRKAVYLLTKIPSASNLAHKWNLNGMGSNTLAKDAYLFWKLKKNSEPKLLGAEVWNVGGLAPVRYPIENIMREHFG